MASPAIFSGRRTKLLTADALLKSNGQINDFDGTPDFLPNGHAEVNTVGWTAGADIYTLTSTDTVGDAVNIRSVVTGTTVAPYVGQPFYYTGTTASGGLTLNTTYYVVGPVLGSGTSADPWFFQLSATPGGAAINLTSTAGDGVSFFRPFQPMVGGTVITPTITWTRDTAAPLMGIASFVFTKDASNRLGENEYADFTIPAGYQGQVVSINMLTKTSANFVTSDLTAWIYDVTNNRIIQPSAFQVVANPNGGAVQPLTFQTASNSVSYRIYFHVSSISALAYTVTFDSITIKPQVTSLGFSATDAADYPGVYGAGMGTVTTNRLTWAKLGNIVRIEGAFQLGTVSGSAATVALPPGLISDPNELPSYNKIVGTWTVNSLLASTPKRGTVLISPNSSLIEFGFSEYSIAVNPFVAQGAGTLWSNLNIVSFSADIPILGFSSSTIASDNAATRVVAAKASTTGTPTVNPNNSYIKVPFNSVVSDTHGTFDTSLNRYVVKTPGPFNGTAHIVTAGTNVLNTLYFLSIYKNGVLFTTGQSQYPPAASNVYLTVSFFDPSAVVNDYYEVYFYGLGNNSASPITLFNGPSVTSFSVSQVQGPAQIQAATVVAARYFTATTQSIPNSITIVNFDTKTTDYTGSVTTGAAWRFTAPGPGDFDVRAQITYTAFTASNATLAMYIYKNGSPYSQSNITTTIAGVSQNWGSSIADQVPMITGDFIDIRIVQTSGVSQTLVNNPATNTVSITRVGGVN